MRFMALPAAGVRQTSPGTPPLEHAVSTSGSPHILDAFATLRQRVVSVADTS